MKIVEYIITVGIVFILTTVPAIFGESPQLSKAETSSVISRSAAIIKTAQRFAAEGGKCDGLGLTLSHQIYARQLFMQGDYANAGFHSLRARGLAGRIISINKNSIIYEALYNRNEERMVQSSPSGRELDRRLKGAKANIISDQAAATMAVDLEI